MLLIRNGKLFTMEGEYYLDGADIFIQEGKIAAVGRNLSAPGVKAIDATGQYVMPGIVDAHSHIGMWAPMGTKSPTQSPRSCARSTRSIPRTAALWKPMSMV